MSDLVERLEKIAVFSKDLGGRTSFEYETTIDEAKDAVAELSRLTRENEELRKAAENREYIAITAAEADIARLISSHDAFDCPDNMTFVCAANLIATDIVERFGRLATAAEEG